MFKQIFRAIAAAFSAVASTVSEGVRGAWEMTVKDGKQIWTWVQPVTRRAAVAMQPAFDVAWDIATLPLRAVASVLSGPPSAAATQSVDTEADRMAAEAKANFERALAQPERKMTAAECAIQQARSVLYCGVASPDTRHLALHERCWIYGIDNDRKANAVSSSLPEDITRHLSGEVTSIRLHRVPNKKQLAEIQAGNDEGVRIIRSSELTQEEIDEIHNSVGKMVGPR